MKFIKRFNMLLVYMPNTEDVSLSKILKISSKIPTTVFLDNHVGNFLKQETIEIDRDEVNIVLNQQNRGLLILTDLNQTGAGKQIYHNVEGINFPINYQGGVKSHKIFKNNYLLILSQKNSLTIYSFDSLASKRPLGIFPDFSCKTSCEISQLEFSQNEEFITLIENSISGVTIDVLTYERIPGYGRKEDTFRISIQTKIQFFFPGDLTFDVSNANLSYAHLPNGDICSLSREKKLKFFEKGNGWRENEKRRKELGNVMGRLGLVNSKHWEFNGIFVLGENEILSFNTGLN